MKFRIAFLSVIISSFLMVACSDKGDDVTEPEKELTEQEIEALCKQAWEKTEEIMGDSYLHAVSPSDLMVYADKIKTLKYIEDVNMDEDNFYIQLKNGSVWVWSFNMLKSSFHKDDSEDLMLEENSTRSLNEITNQILTRTSTPHLSKRNHEYKTKVLIFNQTFNDESRIDEKQAWEELKMNLEDIGFEVTIKTDNYYMNDFDEYEIVIIHTHGGYVYFKDGEFQHMYLTSKELDKKYSQNCNTIKEIRGGKKKQVVYEFITESQFRSIYSNRKLDKKGTLIFSTACNSLKENEELAHAFTDNGAVAFIGYTDSSSVGIRAAKDFFSALIDDCTIQEAFEQINPQYKHQTSYTDEDGKVTKLDAWLKIEYNNNPLARNYCYAHLCPDDKHPHPIDMGYGIKWSCCNIGASTPYEVGNFYSWGETKTKTKYNEKDNDEIQNKNRLKSDIAGSEYDAAWVHSSEVYKMPSTAECNSLLNNCEIKWNNTGNVGAQLISKINGNTLFIPAGGWIYEGKHMGEKQTCLLWTAERMEGSRFSNFMQIIYENGHVKGEIATSRYSGHNVRGVYAKKSTITE